jgi:hypothetical protein
MPGYRYSAASAEGRQAGLDPLELTGDYEGLVVGAVSVSPTLQCSPGGPALAILLNRL